MTQQQFLNVIDRDLAEQRFRDALNLAPRHRESVALSDALGRVLCCDVAAEVDVPSFDRSNYDGYAVRASDTFGAAEEQPRRVELLDEVIATAVQPSNAIAPGSAMEIATGGMVPRGADAVVMVEDADVEEGRLLIRRPVPPGFGISFAGTDIVAGEIVLHQGTPLTSRDTGVLAAIGKELVEVWALPRVAILSTGDEIIEPGKPMRPGLVYDSNARIIADAVRELGCQAVVLGIVRDDADLLRTQVQAALSSCDAVLLSGGTSKGAGDISYHVVAELDQPGIVAHGVALKPGKPICLAVQDEKPVVVLPGFPTSAVFTFHEFVAPVLRSLAGQPSEAADEIDARLAVKINSQIGRTEYVLVGLVEDDSRQLSAFPMGKGSGSVTAYSRADGFISVARHREIVESGEQVRVRLLGRGLQPSDLVVVGSHCVGLDYLLSRMQQLGWSTKSLAVGSMAGLEAVRRGECDLAGVHLLDAESNLYNQPFLTETMVLVDGYRRRQGILYRKDDERFAACDGLGAVDRVKQLDNCLMINRNAGSGTRVLIEQILDGWQPPGYGVQPRNHHAVAAAVKQSRADWGVAIESVADGQQLGFLPLADEHYDFVVPATRLRRPAVVAFRELLESQETRAALQKLKLSKSGNGTEQV